MNPQQIKPRRIPKLLYGVKHLREETGASFAHIRAALEETGGDMERAKAALHAKGIEIASKKQSRDTHAGIIEAYVHHGASVGVLLELRSETDFVARNPAFKELAHEIAMHVAATDPADITALEQEPFIKDESKTIGDLIAARTAHFGERLQIGRFVRYALS